ncbi:MAG: hypothetical protein Q9164_002515 [Protoblastenia rupestris]
MPRATRAALRAQELVEEATTAAAIALPSTPTKERVPLGEISDNVTPSTKMVASEEHDEVEKKPAAKGRKGKGGRKGKKQAKEKEEDNEIEILEDEHHSSQSDAVDEACNDLLNNAVTDIQQIALPDRSITPPSPAVETAAQDLSPKKTPRFDPEVHKAMDSVHSHDKHNEDKEPGVDDDSRPTRHVSTGEQLDPKPLNNGNDDTKDDSFVEQIKTRTPAKRVSRIEDSVEALDALEDEIEKVGEAIPNTARDLTSASNAKRPARTATNPNNKTIDTPVKLKKPVSPTAKMDRGIKNPRPPAVRPAVRRSPPAPDSTTSGLNRSKTVYPPQSSAAANDSAPASTKARLPPSKRVSSIHKAPFQPTKSTKPPTKSSFELPGEAVARKLKEQREERQKREEEEPTKPRPFKARPVRLSQAPVVKLTAATKARLSLAQNAPVDESKPKAALRTGTASAVGANRRQSTLSVAKRPSPSSVRNTTPPSANTAVKRIPSLSISTTSHQASGSAPSADDLALQKLKGKEVFSRTKVALSERENEKKAKEEAARKARAEAAERGRIASREWAEKQKARKLAASTVKKDGEAEAAVAA